ncbi:ATPase AAA [Natrialba chahannaoensis JCM 10990]|uniref:ATPase AAA n=1 Tax=Natrialba chahannaoensis JCM 10990 TaxID=1227492 RepID=M0ATN7_9EURY|nr:hypothetical protein [Natrialba chahannaoensis]ELZ02051.1 ATPase AAA [Natrialba chahannaoensis JCM 10990]
MIAIAYQQVEWLARLSDDVEPNFAADAQLEFRKYDEAELVDILEPRIDRGLIGQPATTEQLE